MAPTDSDERMAPPSLPTPASVSQNQSQSPQETIEKYRKLKRRYAELEEESNTDTNRSGDRNVRMREEKDYLREKLREMETNGSISPSMSPILSSASYTSSSIQASSSTLPRTLLDPKARTSFENNLREAMDEGDADDDLDPLLTSRHLGPLAKKRGEEERNGFMEGDGSGTRKTGHTRGPSGGAQVGNSPRLRGQNPAEDRRLAEEKGDVEMEDGHGHGYSYSRHSSNGTRRDRQERDDRGSENANPSSSQSSKRETRSSRATRGMRNDGAAIAAVAAAAADAEAAAATAAAQSPPPGQPPTNGQQSSRTDPSNGTHLAHNTSSTLANALGLAASTQGPPSREPGTVSTPPSQGYHMRSPSMESILKVAEAAVAAQNAAAATKASASSAIQSNVDPNLDPSLFSPSKNGGISSASSASSNKPPSVNTAVANATASTSTSETPTPTPTSSLSNNPYLSLSTNLLPRTSPGSTTPTGHPMLIPYPMYYPPPPPGTPGTPNSPQYPIPYNPYYYLTTPMAPGANGMYPAPVQFPPAAPAQQQRPAAEPQRPKGKRLKAHTVTTRSFSIPMVPRDKKNKPMLPLNVGIMTVISLGDVCMREHFHTERYIFPVGYEVTRRYLSTVDPTVEVVYHCTILDGGDGPKFQIIPSDRPDKPIIAGTATGAWSNIVKQANAIRNRQHSNSVSGPDFFGLGQNTIKHLIQELPNADRLRDYVWQNFIEGGPLGGRHAAVIPALPEEYDASMPIGAYYPKRDTTSDPNVPRGLSHYPQHIIAQAEAQKAQKLAAQRIQGQPIAGPSGSNASSSQQSVGPSHNPQPGQPPMLVSLGGPASELNIHEYQPPQPHPQAQSVSQGPERRSTRSTAASTNSAPPKTSTSTSAHHTRSASRGNPRQQPLQTSAPPPVPPSLNADGTMPTTFADIMNAYPVPGVQVPPASNPTGTSGS